MSQLSCRYAKMAGVSNVCPFTGKACNGCKDCTDIESLKGTVKDPETNELLTVDACDVCAMEESLVANKTENRTYDIVNISDEMIELLKSGKAIIVTDKDPATGKAHDFVFVNVSHDTKDKTEDNKKEEKKKPALKKSPRPQSEKYARTAPSLKVQIDKKAAEKLMDLSKDEATENNVPVFGKDGLLMNNPVFKTKDGKSVELNCTDILRSDVFDFYYIYATLLSTELAEAKTYKLNNGGMTFTVEPDGDKFKITNINWKVDESDRYLTLYTKNGVAVKINVCDGIHDLSRSDVEEIIAHMSTVMLYNDYSDEDIGKTFPIQWEKYDKKYELSLTYVTSIIVPNYFIVNKAVVTIER